MEVPQNCTQVQSLSKLFTLHHYFSPDNREMPMQIHVQIQYDVCIASRYLTSQT